MRALVTGASGFIGSHIVERLVTAGDSVRGADLLVTALADARRAAEAIDGYLRGEKAAA